MIATFTVDQQSSRELRQYLTNVVEQCACSSDDVISGSDSWCSAPRVVVIDNLHHVTALGDAFGRFLADNRRPHRYDGFGLCFPLMNVCAFVLVIHPSIRTCGVTVAPARLDMPQSALRPAAAAGPVLKFRGHSFRGVTPNKYVKMVHPPHISKNLTNKLQYLEDGAR